MRSKSEAKSDIKELKSTRIRVVVYLHWADDRPVEPHFASNLKDSVE
jgi:hypothetical protein